MTAAERFFCAEAARGRGDPMAGTAPRCGTWVLVEHRGGWPVDGFDGLELEPGTKALVSSAAQAERARVLLIRRHGRRRHEGPRRWAVLRHDESGAHRQQWGTWDRDEDLAGIATALGAPGETGFPPVLLVCAHSQHDPCCAVRGRPVGDTLSERWPEQLWECSHVGGDRFAANLLVLPDAALYGGLDAADAVPLVEDHLTGAVRAARLRGVAGVRPPAQAAVVAAYERLGPLPWGAVHPLALQEHGEGRWEVALQVEGHGAVTVDVVVHRQPAHRLTCRADQPSRALVPVAGDLRPRTPAGAPAPRTDTG